MPGTVFPWRSGNSFSLLCDGPAFFPRMLAALEGARQCVELELYLVESGRCADVLLQALGAAAQRGVQVRCLFDGYGGRGLRQADRERLQASGAQLRWYNPIDWRKGLYNFQRDHRKLLLVDGRLAFVGGAGITDQFWRPGEADSDWHEVMVEAAGPLVGDWLQLFEHQWRACEAPELPRRWRLPTLRRRLPPPPPAEGLGRVAYANARQHRDILQSLVRALCGAQRRIWLATPYFLPTWKVRRALRRAAARGVDVRLLSSGRLSDHPPVRFAGERYFPKLLRAGVRVYEYQPRFLHLKMVLVDDWVSIGSCNFDHWNLLFNLDANLEALDQRLTEQVLASFQADFTQSLEISPELWQAQPFGQRVQQRLWGWLDRLVVNLLDRRR